MIQRHLSHAELPASKSSGAQRRGLVSQGKRPWRQTLAAVAALAVVAATLAQVQADSLRASGFNYSGVTIESVEDGKIFYTTATGAETSQDLKNVEWVKLDRLPDLGQAEDARIAGDLKKAIPLYVKAAQRAQADWSRRLAYWRLLEAARQDESASEAINAYLQLIHLKSSAFFTGEPPLILADKLTEAERAQYDRFARQVIASANAEQRPQLTSLLEILQGGKTADKAVEQAKEAAANAPKSTDGGKNAAFGAALQKYGLTLYSRAEYPGITEFLSNGDFEKAIQQTGKAINAGPEQLPMKLYLMGMAQLALAEQSGDPEDYKVAAISFIRVPIHYSRHSFRLPCLVEAAYCHIKFDRPALASKLLDDAEKELEEGEYPEYTERIDAMRTQIQETLAGDND